jgi:hypothetical protein
MKFKDLERLILTKTSKSPPSEEMLTEFQVTVTITEKILNKPKPEMLTLVEKFALMRFKTKKKMITCTVLKKTSKTTNIPTQT